MNYSIKIRGHLKPGNGFRLKVRSVVSTRNPTALPGKSGGHMSGQFIPSLAILAHQTPV